MGSKCVKYVLYLVFGMIVMGKDIDKICDMRSISSDCPRNETCTPESNEIGRCKCVAGHKRNGIGVCAPDSAVTTPPPDGVTASPRVLPPNDEHGSTKSGSSVAAGVLIPLVVIACLVSVVFLARRYRWPQRIRQLRARHYDEMQIGHDDDDDPPIA